MKLRDLFDDGAPVEDDDLTELFRELQTMMETCCDEAPPDHLECLRDKIANAAGAPWNRAAPDRPWLEITDVETGTVANATARTAAALASV